MSNVAILGHATRGKEVIEILEMLGGKNKYHFRGDEDEWFVLNGNIQRSDWLFAEKGFTLEEFLEMFPYKVGDKVQHKWATSCGSVYEVEKMRWVDNHVEYTIKRLHYNNCHSVVTAQDLQPYKETMEDQYLNPKANRMDKEFEQEFQDVKDFFEKYTGITVQDIRDNNAEWLLNKLQEMSAEGALKTISDLYDELHTPKYPKTYVECAKILECFSAYNIDGYKNELLEKLQELLICRDAYWKIAGNWKPNLGETFIYAIGACYGVVEKRMVTGGSGILLFPTEEMRDAFYENFKELIESCKELL